VEELDYVEKIGSAEAFVDESSGISGAGLGSSNFESYSYIAQRKAIATIIGSVEGRLRKTCINKFGMFLRETLSFRFHSFSKSAELPEPRDNL
jgi:hypothetical protein